MGFARPSREIAAFPHGPTDRSFLLLFFKKEGACLLPTSTRNSLYD
jgi:hypothetical protein